MRPDLSRPLTIPRNTYRLVHEGGASASEDWVRRRRVFRSDSYLLEWSWLEETFQFRQRANASGILPPVSRVWNPVCFCPRILS